MKAATFAMLLTCLGPLRAQNAPDNSGDTYRARTQNAPLGIVIEGFMQARFEDTRFLRDTTSAGQPRPRDQQYLINGYRLRRLRLRMTAYWNDATSIRLQLALQQTGWGKVMEDAYIRRDFGNDGRYQLFIGQFKVPFNREELRPATEQLVLDRGLVNAVLVANNWASRQQGILLSSRFMPFQMPLNLQVMFSNGDGVNEASDPTPLGKLYSERAAIELGGNLEVAVSTAQAVLGRGDAYGPGADRIPQTLKMTASSFDFGLSIPLSEKIHLNVDGEYFQFDNISGGVIGPSRITLNGWSGDPTITQDQIDMGSLRLEAYSFTPALYVILPYKFVQAVDLSTRYERLKPAGAEYDIQSAAYWPTTRLSSWEVALGVNFLDNDRKNNSRLQLAVSQVNFPGDEIATANYSFRELKMQWQVKY